MLGTDFFPSCLIFFYKNIDMENIGTNKFKRKNQQNTIRIPANGSSIISSIKFWINV